MAKSLKPKQAPYEKASKVCNNAEIKGKSAGVDAYFSHTNCWPHNCESILAANARARLEEKDNAMKWKHGMIVDFNPQTHKIRQRYNDRMVRPGMATYSKSEDMIY